MSGKRARWSGSERLRRHRDKAVVGLALIFLGWLLPESPAPVPFGPWLEDGTFDPPYVEVAPAGAPPQGVIGVEDRVPLAKFVPDDAMRFPGWRSVLGAVVYIGCDGAVPVVGSAVLLDRPDRILTAAHVLIGSDGRPSADVSSCRVWRDGSLPVRLRAATITTGGYRRPDVLSGRFSTEIAQLDWVVVDLEGPVAGGMPLRLARKDELILSLGQPVLALSGPVDNLDAGQSGSAQVCRYLGPPPTSSTVAPDGSVTERYQAPGDRWTVARYDCDAGRGASGSPVIGWSPAGEPVIWGILSESVGKRLVCPHPGLTSCFSAGPLATAIIP
jgi:Trypsin-like peptidase domain